MSDRPLARRAALALALAGLWAWQAKELGRAWWGRPERASEVIAFQSEGAFYYRYARLVAEGGAIPRVDLSAGSPVGLDVLADMTGLPMALAQGLSFRAFRRVCDVPFTSYLSGFVAFCLTLNVVMLYATLRGVGLGRWHALLPAVLFGVSRAGIGRAAVGYGLEEFSIPLLLASVALVAPTLAETRPSSRPVFCARAFGAALAVNGAVATWHFSRAFYALFALTVAAAALTAPASERWKIERSAVLLAACAAVSGAMSAVVPVFHGASFLSSAPVLCVLIGLLLLAARLQRGWRARTLVAVAGAAAVSAVCVLGRDASPAGPEFRHVGALLSAKIVNLGSKPEEPLLLPPEARFYWRGPYRSPSLGVAVYALSTLWPLAAFGAAAARSRRRSVAVVWLLLLGGAFLAGFALFERLMVLLAAFLAAVAGLALGPSVPPNARRRAAALLLLSIAFETGISSAYLSGRPDFFKSFVKSSLEAPERTRPAYHDLSSLISWARTTGPEDAFLSDFSLLPSILTYANRPIVQHAVVEAPGQLDSMLRFFRALYSDGEETLYRLAVEKGARFFVYRIEYALDTGPESWRYVGGSARLSRDSAAYLFHFRPERLRRFRLVYQDPGFRAFRVGEGGAGFGPLPYYPIYDPSFFGEGDGAGFLDDAAVEAGWGLLLSGARMP